MCNLICESFEGGMKKWPLGGGFGHWRRWLTGFARNQPGHPRTNFLLVTVSCRFVLLISAGPFQEALRLQRDAGTLGRCLIQLGQGSAALLRMGCPSAPRCLQFVRLGVSVWLFFLQKPKGFPEPTTALLQFQSPEQHFLFPSNKQSNALVLLRRCPVLTCTTSQNQAQFFLSGSASSRSSPSWGSPAGLSSPQDPNPLPAHFPVGLLHVSEEQELLRGDHGLREAEGWKAAQQCGGWPGRLGASSICEQTHQCPLPAWEPWQRTALKPMPALVVPRDSLVHPPGKGKSPLRWKLNLEPVLPVALLQSWAVLRAILCRIRTVKLSDTGLSNSHWAPLLNWVLLGQHWRTDIY